MLAGVLLAYVVVGFIAGTWAWLDREFPNDGYWFHVAVFMCWGTIFNPFTWRER